MQTDSKYIACIVESVDCIIRCFIIPKDKQYASQFNAPSAFFNNSDSSLVLKLDVNSNAIVKKCQMHLSTHNVTCYKYGAAAIRQCRFDFPCPTND